MSSESTGALPIGEQRRLVLLTVVEALGDLERHVVGRLVRGGGRQLGSDGHVSHGLL